MLFTSYDLEDKEIYGKSLYNLSFNGRHDFVHDDEFAGIAVRIDFHNDNFLDERGVRRKVEFTLIDQNDRVQVFSLTRNIRIPATDYLLEYYLDLSAAKIKFKGGNTYRLVVRDITMESMLGEYTFRLYSRKKYGNPAKWYGVECGGVCTPYWKRLNKSLKVEEYEKYLATFLVELNMGSDRPAILPELEMHLYCAATGEEKAVFVEPQHIKDGLSCEYYVELPFEPHSGDYGAYYAELLCMGEAIGGFVFDTTVDAEMCEWKGSELEPMGEYDPERARMLARWRLEDYMPPKDDDSPEDDDSTGRVLEAEEAASSLNTDDGDTPSESAKTEEAEPAPGPTMAESLSVLTGLDSVKSKLLAYEKIVRFNKLRSDSGLPVVSMPLHTMFLGSSGTGKTTVARMLGSMLHDAGVLSSGHVVVRERATLLGQFYNSEAEKTLAAIEEAQGGILFIDEAYQLFQPNDPRDPGKFVIETLLTSLADETKRDWMLILAGYPEPMLKLLEMNPGFKSRIPAPNIYRFEDFSGDELVEIARRYLVRSQYRLTPEADEALAARLMADYENRDKNFGNGRHVMNLIQTEILPAMAKRVVDSEETGSSSLTDIMAADIPPFVERALKAAPRIGFAF